MSHFFRKYFYYGWSLFELFFGFADPILVAKIFLNQVPAGVKTVSLRRGGLRFRVRGAMDVWSIKETFLDRFYETCGFTIQPGWNVIDIGAGVGDYTLYAASQPNVRVFAFEPYLASFALAQENLGLNAITNAQVFNEAIGATSGKLTLDLTGGEPLQFQSRLENDGRVKNGLSVNALSLFDALTRLGLESCDLLKLDCEGAEYAILFGTPQPVLQRIRHIVMEYHDDVVQHNHEDLARFLREHGFQVDTFPNPVHSQLGYLRALRKN